MAVKSLRQIKRLAGQTVLLRVDFNVAMKNGRVVDDYRIVDSLETINWLLAKKCRLIIIAHLGEPVRQSVAYSLRPVAARLRALLKKPVKFVPQAVGPKADAARKKLKPGEIIFLENLRFEKGELANDPAFAKRLATGADYYINDAFAVSHRDQASVSAIKKYLPSYAGLLLEKEVKALNKVLKPKPPLVVIIGGEKITTKAPLIGRLYAQADKILLGSALADNFFRPPKPTNRPSFYDVDVSACLKQFFVGRKLKPKIILPVDVVVKTKSNQAQAKSPAAVKPNEAILDIGPKTISLFAPYIKAASTLVWNGPMGQFEDERFRFGTLAIARLVASRASGPAYGVVGGGETLAALKMSQMAEYVDWISTAGGAMLTYLGGGKMPGLDKIVTKS